jgi:hypothetical protein
MNHKKWTVLAVVILVLGVELTASAQTPYTFDWKALAWECEQLQDQVATAADGFGLVRELAKMALSAPNDSTQESQLEDIVYLLEGTGGVDVRVTGISMNAVFSDARALMLRRDPFSSLLGGPWPTLEPSASTLLVIEGGAAGAAASAGPLVRDLEAFVRQNRDPLVAYYAATYGTNGNTVVEARLAAIQAMQSDVEVLARHALAAALDAVGASDSQSKRSALLDLYASSVAIGGMDPTPESSDWDSAQYNLIGAWVGDLESLAGDFYRAVAQLDEDMVYAVGHFPS